MTNPFEILSNRLESLENLIREQGNSTCKENLKDQTLIKNPINDFIAKSEIRGNFASSSTLWKLENEGKLTVYGVGGKRYYKKDDIEKLFKPLNTKQ